MGWRLGWAEDWLVDGSINGLMGLCSHLFLVILMICGHLLLMFFVILEHFLFLVIFEGLGALGSDGGVQGRFLVKNGPRKPSKNLPFGGQFSMMFTNFREEVFQEAPGSKNHRQLIEK